MSFFLFCFFREGEGNWCFFYNKKKMGVEQRQRGSSRKKSEYIGYEK
jgi:hypothetical protein